MRNLRTVTMVLAALAVPALLALGVHLAAGSSLTAPPAAVARVSTEPLAQPSRPVTSSTTTTTTTSTTEDISGPCDEAEHRNDPRCAPGATTTTTRDDGGNSNRGHGSDNSGSGSDNSGSGSSGRGRGRGRSGGDD
jgi:hypothetical protein